MSEIEWYALRAYDEPKIDVRAVRRFPGPPAYHAIARFRLTEAQAADPAFLRIVGRWMLGVQREIDAEENVAGFVDRPSAKGVIKL